MAKEHGIDLLKQLITLPPFDKMINQGPSERTLAEGPQERLPEEDERILENRRVKFSSQKVDVGLNATLINFFWEFIATLDEQMVCQLCVRAMSRGVRSMEYVDSLLIMEDEDHNDSGNANAFSEDSAGLSQAQQTDLSAGSVGSQHPLPPSEPTPNWCKCQQCQPMAQDIENRCCGYRNRITTKRRFQKLCLDPEVLELCIRNRADIRNDRENNSTSSFRKAAYRQFILEKYGRLGKGNRKVAPSCVVLRVRRQYPSPTGIYMGFRAE
ncbi:uncharacterized protein LOC144638536 [Oculina patagonica]